MSGSYSFPASFAQEVLWLLDRASPGLTAYSVPRARRLRGRLDVDALSQALDRLIARHEILRTTYLERDGAVHQIVAPSRPAELEVTDLSELAVDARDARIGELVLAQARRPFDLGKDLLLRSFLIRIAPDDHVLILTTHHIASDGWSGAVMIRELFECYEALRQGHEPTLPELPIQYGDFAAWQREQLSGDRLEALLTYWRSQLAGPLPVLSLPTDRARPSAPGYAGDRIAVRLDSGVVIALRELGQRHGATLYMVLLAAYQVMLSRWSGQDDVLVGSPIANRERPETEGLIGYLANTLVLRARMEDDPTFTTHLARTRATCLDAYEHQNVPLERLATDLREAEHLSDGSLYRAVFTQLDDTSPSRNLPELSIEPFGFDHGTVKFDFTLFLMNRSEGVQFSLHFRSDLFERSTAQRFLGHLTTLLGEIAANPDRPISAIPILTPQETADLARWDQTATDLGEPTTLAALLTAQRQAPEGPAVVCGDVVLTWNELMARSSQIAWTLQEWGVQPDDRVGLCFGRSTDLIVGMTGILLSGGGYVPLLTDQPRARLTRIIGASQLKVVVTTSAEQVEWPEGVRVLQVDRDRGLLASQLSTPPVHSATPDSLAYVLFTSGSTGEPKGVAVTHGNLVHYVRAISHRLGLPSDLSGPAWHCASVSTLAADLGHTAVFTALGNGGVLHLLPEAIATDPARFQEYMEGHAVDLLKITPNHLRALLGTGISPRHLPRRWLVLGGEACPWDLTEQLRGVGGPRILNHYGPTEATVGACTYLLDEPDQCRAKAATVPIGKPIANMRAEVRSARGQQVPVGVTGELWLGGPGIARGYLGAEDLTSIRFVNDSRVPGLRWYRTGDRVRRLPSGDLEFLGRMDTQVKVRGYRVELGEIEAVLSSHPLVRQAAVALHEEALVAYVVLSAALDDEHLSRHAAESLPDYMVPAVWMRPERLPLTPNGKLDRAALPAPVRVVTGSRDRAPQTDSERALAAIWMEVLKKEVVERDGNFFTLGGHSLLAIRLLGRIVKLTGVRLSLRDLFEHPTIADLATVLDSSRQTGATEATAPAGPPSAPNRASREAYRRPATRDPNPAGGQPR